MLIISLIVYLCGSHTDAFYMVMIALLATFRPL